MINIYVEIKDRPSGNGQSVQVASNVYLYLEHFIFHPTVYFRKRLKYNRKVRDINFAFSENWATSTVCVREFRNKKCLQHSVISLLTDSR